MEEPKAKKRCRRIEVCVDGESHEWCTVKLTEWSVVKDVLNSLLIDNHISYVEGYGLATINNIDVPVSSQLAS